MKFSSIILALSTLMVLSSCSNVYTWSDATPGTNFSDYTTYQIDDQCSDYNPGVNPINQQRIKNAIEVELRDLGYKRSEDADINVKFYLKNETKYFYENCANEYEDYTNGQVCIERAYAYDEGTLIIDLFDTKKNEAVWHGGVSGDSWEKMKDPTSSINQSVKAIFKDYKSALSTPGYAGITQK